MIAIVFFNGLSLGLLLYLVASGLTLSYSLMGVLNFAHGAFFMLGAYLSWSIGQSLGLTWAWLLSPCLVGLLGAAVYQWGLDGGATPMGPASPAAQRAHHQRDMLVTFGLSLVLQELITLVWGREPLSVSLPPALQGPAWVWGNGVAVSKLRVLVMFLALGVIAALAAAWRWTPWGLVVRAARSRPEVAQALGWDVVTVQRGVFAMGAGLAGLAGALMASTRLAEPGMGASVGALVFALVVMGGLGSLVGTWWASLGVGLLEAAAVAWADGFPQADPGSWAETIHPWAQGLGSWAPVLPYALLIVLLSLRPQGLAGRRR